MEKRQLIRSAGPVGFFILLSRVLGLVREMAMATFFGSSLVMDAFVAAFAIPNLFRGLFGEGALSSAYVPVFTESLEKEGREKAWVFANKMFSLLALILAAIVIAGLITISIARLIVPDTPRIMTILDLAHIMLPYMFFICLAAFFAAMLNSLRHFFLPAATYATLNIIMIVALLLVCPHLSAEGNTRIMVVAWSVIVAGIVQWLMQLPLLWKCGFRLRLNFDWRDMRVHRVWKLMGAAAIGVGVTQINFLLVDRAIALLIGQGYLSYLNYAERLIYLPLGMFGTALGTVLLPAFSTHVTQSRPDLILRTMNHSIRQLTFMALPAAMGLLVLAKPIIQVIYERGRFSPHATDMTALALVFYAPGLLSFCLLKVLIPVFYAHQDVKTPLKLGLICTGLSVIFKLILIWPLKHAGIAFGTVIATTIEVLIMFVLIHRRFGSPGWGNISYSTLKILVAGTAMSLTALAINKLCLQFLGSHGAALQLARIVSLSVSIVAAIAAYVVSALLLRCEEAKELWSALQHKTEHR